jgi:membrane protein
MKVVDRLRSRGTALYRTVNRRLGGAPEVLVNAGRAFSEARGAESAASLAYYALFALFPFLLVLIFVGTLFLGSKRAETELIGMVTQMLPGSQLFIQQNLADIMGRRGALTLIGVIGLLWSSGGFFSALSRNLRRAWPDFQGLNMIAQRLGGIVAVLVLGLLLIVWSAVNVIFSSIPQLFDNVPGMDEFWSRVVRIAPVLIVLPMLAGLYRWTSPRDRGWRGVLIGALLAAVLLQALILGFGWYLTSGLVNYDRVYGSLGGVIALLVFVYLMSFVILFGAYLAAAVEGRRHAPRELDAEQMGADLTD